MTRLLVLGILDMQPMSGYDIKRMLQLNNAERWGGVLIGSIYHAINKLEEEGLIEISNIEQTGHRQKATYRITPSGQEHLKQLVFSSLREPSVCYPSTLYSGLSFSNKLPKDENRRAVTEQLQLLGNEEQSLKRGWEAKEKAMQNHVPPMTKLIFDHMFSVIRLQQELLQNILALLDTQE
ncbi:PadR family transcriptional regulator [Acetanaerobacterium elongatum]|uniref:Transcriptional regulator, PadR family n=1 Tax=Acetanaerobacterium elongatum TaxID=258515 RepID=A0A1H0D8V3_9FIRM|nr:PadR family transcriptional regulator [Acetanaerobacterium elongatum]SDN66563.1 transcriptional regulator, PadR family [Acetanaerobacterium elongatum]